MPQFEFRNICDTKLESIRRRISRYQQVQELQDPSIIAPFVVQEQLQMSSSSLALSLALSLLSLLSLPHSPRPPPHTHRHSDQQRVLIHHYVIAVNIPFFISCGFQFAQELRKKACPTFKQAGVLTHTLGCMDFVPTNCHINLMQVSHPKTTMVSGRAFSFRFGRKNSFYGLDPDQGGVRRQCGRVGVCVRAC